MENEVKMLERHAFSVPRCCCADDEPATIISITPLEESQGFGPMCSAWQVRGSCLLPADYANNDEGTLFVASIHNMVTAWGDMIPPTSSNKTIYNSL